MNATTPASEHQDIWELLPWLVNGRLSESDCRRVEAHLRICSACREECATQRLIHAEMSTDTAVEQMPMAGLNKLRQRIDVAQRIDAAQHMDGAHRAPGLDAPTGARPSKAAGKFRLRAAAVAASLIALSVALGMPAALRWNEARRAPAAYYTVTSAASQHPGEVIRAVFAPTATLSELQAVLDDAHLKIVSGPTEAGVYSLAMTGPRPIEWSLRRLRGHDTVRFAEALEPAPAPVPAPPR